MLKFSSDNLFLVALLTFLLDENYHSAAMLGGIGVLDIFKERVHQYSLLIQSWVGQTYRRFSFISKLSKYGINGRVDEFDMMPSMLCIFLSAIIL